MKLCDVDDHLDDVLVGLNVVHAKVAPLWIPEQVIDWCRGKKAFLFMVNEGFFVLRPRHIASVNQVWIECLAAYGECRTGLSLVDKYLPIIDQLVRDYGSRKLIFSSPRKAYLRLSGFDIRCITYERNL